jgi:uncharacterized membrane protein
VAWMAHVAVLGPGGGGIILLVVWGVRRLENRGSGDDDERPLAILQRRYAGGEIGPEEYERIRSDLLRDRAGR